MSFVIGILTVLLVLNCLLLILLVLVQQPKKDTGGGLAFGGAATDALFGAGSGNVLTKVTKYATVAFFLLTVGVAYMQSQQHHGRSSEFGKQVAAQPAAVPPAATTTPTPGAITTPSDTNAPVLSLPPASATPTPAATNTEAPK